MNTLYLLQALTDSCGRMKVSVNGRFSSHGQEPPRVVLQVQSVDVLPEPKNKIGMINILFYFMTQIGLRYTYINI